MTLGGRASNLWLFRAYNLLLRLLGGPYVVQTYFGAFLLCDPGDFVQQMVLHFGVWEPNTSALIEKRLCPGDVCADLGANVGYDTLLAAHAVGKRRSVVAVEASPNIFAQLARNIRANAAHNIRLVYNAVSDRPGMLDVYTGPPGNCGEATPVTARTPASRRRCRPFRSIRSSQPTSARGSGSSRSTSRGANRR